MKTTGSMKSAISDIRASSAIEASKPKEEAAPRLSPRSISQSTRVFAAQSSPSGAITIKFAGCFQCRLATDPDPSAAPDGTNGWTFAYGESAFDRIIRFSSPVDLRNALYIPWSVVTVTGVDAPSIPNANSDPVVGQSVNLGPSTYFKGDNVVAPGFEPLANFQFRIGVNSFYSEATNPPTGTGPLTMSAGDESAAGIFPVQMYNNKLTQITLPARLSNLKRLKETYYGIDDNGQHTTVGFVEYTDNFPGQLDKNISINPGNSAVLSALVGQTPLYIKMKFFGYDGDTLVGQISGQLSNMPIP